MVRSLLSSGVEGDMGGVESVRWGRGREDKERGT